MATRRKKKKEPTPEEAIDAILQHERVLYFPIVHFSPTCALQLQRLIHEEAPVGVLVEGPEDANDLIPHLVHEDTWPPLTVFSTYVDKKNQFGLNGVLSPAEEVPARFRGWWPLTSYSPELVALKTGHEVGARLKFIDIPLHTRIPFELAPESKSSQIIHNRKLAESAYFQTLAKRQRRRSFDDFWQANFEVGGWDLDPEAFRRALMTFAWCARHLHTDDDALEALEADGTLTRERHMRYALEAFLKEEPEGRVVVVTGAYHAASIPTIKKKKAKIKKDKNLETLVTAHSFRALANLYKQGRNPGYKQFLWEQMESGAEEPYNNTSMRMLIEVMRKARSAGEGLSTADAIGAYKAALNLAALRGNREVTLADLSDAVTMSYVKGDARIKGGEVDLALRNTLVGVRMGRVTSEAGQAPLMRDYYVQCRANKLDITGSQKIVRCDIHKQQTHRLKSAFLHQCSFLDIPMFHPIDNKGDWRSGYTITHYKGPDLSAGENLHLITETWGVHWKETVDDRLLDISDRGASIAHAAIALVREGLVQARGNASETTTLLLKCAQMMLLEAFDEVLDTVEDAIVQDASFVNLVQALHDFVVLHSYRDALATQGHSRLLNTVVTLFNKACIVLPGIANASYEEVEEMLERLQTLVRITLTFEGVLLDRQLLVEKIQELVQDHHGAASIRGAGFGILFSFGATREKVVARELNGYLLGSPERVLQAGSFLDGLFMSSRNIFMGSPRLLRAINQVLRELDWDTFKMILPDLRRAFTQFIPTEIDHISVRVSEEIGLDEAPSGDEPVPELFKALGARMDHQVSHALKEWLA